jgi:hypothetical protein
MRVRSAPRDGAGVQLGQDPAQGVVDLRLQARADRNFGRRVGLVARRAQGPHGSERLALRLDASIDELGEVAGPRVVAPGAAATAIVRDREIAKQGVGVQRVEDAGVEPQRRAFAAADAVDQLREAATAERADQAADDEPAAECESAARNIGLETRERPAARRSQRARCAAAPPRAAGSRR